MEITRLSEGEKTLKFDMEDIDWKALDFFLEEVEIRLAKINGIVWLKK